MCKTMQQIDHDAWEEGYGVNSTENDDRMNKLELKAMYEALAARKRKDQEEKEKQEQEQENNE